MRALGYPGFGELAADAERFRRRLRRGVGGRGARGAMPAVEAAPLFLPYLGDGERDDPTARAGFVGLSDRHDRAALAFAVIEGVALAVRSVLAVLEQAGSPLSELRTGGGGARIDLAGQLKADLLGRPVTAPGHRPGRLRRRHARGRRGRAVRGGRRGHRRDAAAGTAVRPVRLVERLRG